MVVERGIGAATWRERLVVKLLSPAAGWLGAASGDSRLREAQLWERGLLQSLPIGIATGVNDWAFSGDPDRPAAGALLLDDLTSRLLRSLDRAAFVDAVRKIDELRRDPGLAVRCRALARSHYDLHDVGGARYRRLYEAVLRR